MHASHYGNMRDGGPRPGWAGGAYQQMPRHASDQPRARTLQQMILFDGRDRSQDSVVAGAERSPIISYSIIGDSTLGIPRGDRRPIVYD